MASTVNSPPGTSCGRLSTVSSASSSRASAVVAAFRSTSTIPRHGPDRPGSRLLRRTCRPGSLARVRLFHPRLPWFLKCVGGPSLRCNTRGTTARSSKGVELVSESVTAADPNTEVRGGACLCGRVRFTVTGPVVDPHVCRCTHCAKRSGAPFQWWVGFPMAGLQWTGEGGEPTWHDTYPGKTARGFCSDCGSHIAARDYGDDSVVGILATALDHYDTDPALTPTNLNRVAEAAPWLAPCGRGTAVAT
ncbi:GFA family protein [Streptomyces roseolus]|uniref:GFA family protein n=1 Tax=Streptomyces roseolus TaxID=67358 RepID=UPI003795CA74